MAGKTQADRLLDLEKIVPSIAKQVEIMEKASDALGRATQENVGKFVELRLLYDTTIALLKKEIEEINKWKGELKKDAEDRNRKIWSFGPNIVAAVINVLLSAIIAYLVAK